MDTFKQIEDLQQALMQAKEQNKSIGLVPTMGALHDGHISLIEEAYKKNNFIVVSIFVNPTQFNNKKDLEKYPRDIRSDLERLKNKHVDAVFAPDVQEMYPDDERRIYDLSPLDTVMEGKYRPGHFAGVAEIVSKLFEITSPDNAYFGLKDFQQLAIIRKLADLMETNIHITGCPIIREDDGLAMSSRNQLLSEKERSAAPLIYQTLLRAKDMKTSHSPSAITEFVKNRINSHELMKLEYFEIVDEKELMPISNWGEDVNKIACIAVHLGEVRLIDNIYFD